MKTLIFLLVIALAGAAMYPSSSAAQGSCASYAMRFDGDDDAIEIGGFSPTEDQTVEFWFKLDSVASGRYYPILSSLADPNYLGYQAAPDGYLSAGIDTISNAPQELSDGLDLTYFSSTIESVWWHVAFIYQSGYGYVVVNGEAVANGAGEEFAFHPNNPLLEPLPDTLHIGAGTMDRVYGAGSGAQSFKGLIDEVRIWNTARTQQEIQDNLYRHLDGNEDGLVAYYPFDEGSGSTTEDASGNGHDGTLQNGPTWVESPLELTCPDCTNPDISTQPADAIVYVSDDATFTAASDDDDSPTLQWQRSTNGGSSWSDISDATSGTLTVTDVTMSMNGYRYRAAFTNDCGTSLSDEAVLAVKVAVSDLGPVDVCVGSSTNSNNGNRMDILVELFKNDEEILEGTALNQQVVGNSNNDLTKKYTIALPQLEDDVEFGAEDMLTCRVSVRRNGGSGDFPLRLWYNGDPSTDGGLKAWSRVHKDDDEYYYFRTDDDLSTSSGSSAAYEGLTTSTSYQVIGEWSIAGAAMKRGGRVTLNTELSAQLISRGNATIVRFTAPDGTVTMSLFDVTGRRVQSLAPIEVSSGSMRDVLIPHAGLAAGVYTLVIGNGASRETLRFAVIQ